MRTHRNQIAMVWLAIAGIAVISCDNSTDPGGGIGSLQVSISTTSSPLDLDVNGYTLTVDGGAPLRVGRGALILLPDLTAGKHVVELGDLEPNCAVPSGNPRTVEVKPASRNSPGTNIVFTILCTAKVGAFQVTTVTHGTDADLDGYVILVDGGSRGAIGVNETRKISDLRQGNYGISLGGLSGNCAVAGSNPQRANVTFGATTEVAFSVDCALSGSISLAVSTTGADRGQVEYYVFARSTSGLTVAQSSAPQDGPVALRQFAPGSYEITLRNLPPNCDVAGPNPFTVSVTAGISTEVPLKVECATPAQMAFVNRAGNFDEIFLARSNGTGIFPITAQPGSSSYPAWSPDGSRLAFVSDRSGDPEIYVMNADGTNPVRLTYSQDLDIHPAWSPDGSRIAFVSRRAGSWAIYVMNPDGSNVVRLTTSGGNDSDPAWSPDGSRIVFSSEREGGVGLWVMNSDGSSLSRITTSNYADRQPAWSPGGATIAFTREASGTIGAIFTVRPDGTGITRLTDDVSGASDPAFSPDGRKIAFGVVTGYDWYYYYGSSPEVQFVSSAGVPYYTPLSIPGSHPVWRP